MKEGGGYGVYDMEVGGGRERLCCDRTSSGSVEA